MNPSVYSVNVAMNITGNFVQYKNVSATPNSLVCENQSRCSFPESEHSTFVIVHGDDACSKDDRANDTPDEDVVHVAINLNFPQSVQYTLVYVLIGVAAATVALHVLVLIRRIRNPVRKYKWRHRPKLNKTE